MPWPPTSSTLADNGTEMSLSSTLNTVNTVCNGSLDMDRDTTTRRTREQFSVLDIGSVRMLSIVSVLSSKFVYLY